MSMASELVDKLRSIASSEGFYDDRIPSEKAKIIKMAADTIEELSKKLHYSQMERSNRYYNGGWILCSERLPEEPFGCLVTIIDSNPVTGEDFENLLPCHAGYDGEQWNDADGEEVPFDVISWMRLPEPYKEKLHTSKMERSSQYYNGGWIPVKWHKITEDERKKEGYPVEWDTYLDCLLPNDGDEILITVCGSDGSIHVEIDTCCVDDGFYLYSGYDWLYDVIAWMPLPKPYKESEEIK